MKSEFEPYIVSNVPVTLFRRKPGGHIYYYFRVHGKRSRETTEVFTEREARAFVRPIVIDALANKPISPYVTMKLKDLLQAYYAERWPENSREGNGSYSSAKSSLENFRTIIGDDVFFAATTFDEARTTIHRFIDQRKAFLAAREEPGNFARTLNSDRLRISRLCSWLMKRQKSGAWIANPAGASHIEIPSMVESDPEPLDETETDMIATGGRTREDGTDRPLWPLIVLCLGVGVRPAESIRVTWSDVDYSRHLVSVTNKKSKRARPRYPVMSQWVEAELKSWREKHPAENDATLWPYNRYVAFDHMGYLRAELGLPEHVSLQALRATACTRAILSGMKIADYVMQFGHSLTVAQKHYLKFGKAELEARREQIEVGMFKDSENPVPQNGDTLGTKKSRSAKKHKAVTL